MKAATASGFTLTLTTTTYMCPHDSHKPAELRRSIGFREQHALRAGLAGENAGAGLDFELAWDTAHGDLQLCFEALLDLARTAEVREGKAAVDLWLVRVLGREKGVEIPLGIDFYRVSFT